MSLKFTPSNEVLKVTGKTFHVKDELKTLGGRWNPLEGCWTLPLSSDTPEMRDNLTNMLKEKVVVQKKARAKTVTSEEMVKAALAQKAIDGSYQWICCDQCKIIDWARQHTTCDAHAIDCGLWKNNFFVRGRLYTGD